MKRKRDDRQNRKAMTKLPYWQGKESSKHKRKVKPDHPLIESFDGLLLRPISNQC